MARRSILAQAMRWRSLIPRATCCAHGPGRHRRAIRPGGRRCPMPRKPVRQRWCVCCLRTARTLQSLTVMASRLRLARQMRYGRWWRRLTDQVDRRDIVLRDDIETGRCCLGAGRGTLDGPRDEGGCVAAIVPMVDLWPVAAAFPAEGYRLLYPGSLSLFGF